MTHLEMRETHVIIILRHDPLRASLVDEVGEKRRGVQIRIHVFLMRRMHSSDQREIAKETKPTCRFCYDKRNVFQLIRPEKLARFTEIHPVMLDIVPFSFWRQDATCIGGIGQETRDWVS